MCSGRGSEYPSEGFMVGKMSAAGGDEATHDCHADTVLHPLTLVGVVVVVVLVISRHKFANVQRTPPYRIVLHYRHHHYHSYRHHRSPRRMPARLP